MKDKTRYTSIWTSIGPLLVILGVICVGVGRFRARRKRKHDHEG